MIGSYLYSELMYNVVIAKWLGERLSWESAELMGLKVDWFLVGYIAMLRAWESQFCPCET